MISRRSLTAGLGSFLATPSLVLAAGEPDLDDPEKNLRAFVKLLGALDGAPVFDVIRGSVYALVAGRPPQPLFRTLGAGVATFKKLTPLEYRSTSRYLGLFLDWKSGEPIQSWQNPLNGALCTVPITRYGPGETRVLSGGIFPVGAGAERAPTDVWPWFRLGGVVHMQRAVMQETVPHPLFPKADLMTYSGDARLLTDPTVRRMPSRLNFSAVESWREWMKMQPSDPQGTLWWHVAGVKLDSGQGYPPQLREWILREAPDFFAT
jgi:hypothetical protein